MSSTLAALPLGSLRGFDAAMRRGSFTAAAQELHLTHGAVSRQIRALEETAGTKLFERRNRSVFPTAAAIAFHRQVLLAFETLAAGLREIHGPNEGPIVVSCEPTLTRQWLIPRLSRKSPQMTLDVSVAGGAPDFGSSNIDVAIRRSDFELPTGVLATPLMDEWMGPVCHPTIARGKRKKGIVRVHSASRPDAWDTWEKRTGKRVHFGSTVTFEHFWLSLEAAVSGLGYAMAPYPLVERELREARLVAPFGFVRGSHRYVALTRAPTPNDARVTKLVRWLRAEARAMVRAMPPSLQKTAVP